MRVRQKNIEKRRQRILAAAREIIAESGPDALSMRELAKKSGLAVTTLYNLFGNKESIQMALYAEAISSVEPFLATQDERDPLSALLAGAETPVEHLIEHKAAFQPIIQMEYFNHGERASPRSMSFYVNVLGIIRSFVEPAQADGAILAESSVDLIAAELFYAYRGAIEDWCCCEIDDDMFRRRVKCAFLFVLLAVATDSSRPVLQKELMKIQAAATEDLQIRFGGSAKG